MNIFSRKTYQQKLDAMHKETDELVTKYRSTIEVLDEMLESTHVAIGAAHKHMEKVYIALGKITERKKHAEDISKAIYREFEDDEDI